MKITLELTDSVVDRMKVIGDRVGVEGHVDLIRRALALYDTLCIEHRRDTPEDAVSRMHRAIRDIDQIAGYARTGGTLDSAIEMINVILDSILRTGPRPQKSWIAAHRASIARRLAEAWAHLPDTRLGTLIAAALGGKVEALLNLDDEVLVTAIETYAEAGR